MQPTRSAVREALEERLKLVVHMSRASGGDPKWLVGHGVTAFWLGVMAGDEADLSECERYLDLAI